MTNEEKQLLLKDLCERLPHKAYIEIVDEGVNENHFDYRGLIPMELA